MLIAVLLPGCDTGTSLGRKSETEQQTTAANDFVNTWVNAGSASAVAALDSRAVDAVKEAVRTMKLRRFDGNVWDVGDGIVTVYATGDQYPVRAFQVNPVMDLGGRFMPVPLRISVAKDTNKVIAVVPQVEGL